MSTPPPAGSANRQLVGGWRIAQDYPQGCIAIDFSRMKLWMGGHAQRAEIVEYDLPAMGTGTNVNSWPAVTRTRVIAPWWDVGYPNGLVFWRGKLWCSPRVFYDTVTPGSHSLWAQDGEKIAVSLPRQVFAGFVKRGPGLDPFIGCGGYESGQGSVSGPTLATIGGQKLIQYEWPALPGANLENWNKRAPRDTNYSITQDDWVAWNPRTVNGKLEGRWASDRIYGGGLVLPEGITYWPSMGTGSLVYSLQTPTFAPYEKNVTYQYRYNPTTYTFVDFTLRPDFGPHPILGQELGPDGKVYLAHAAQWQSPGTDYQTDVAIKVYG